MKSTKKAVQLGFYSGTVCFSFCFLLFVVISPTAVPQNGRDSDSATKRATARHSERDSDVLHIVTAMAILYIIIIKFGLDVALTHLIR